MALTFPRTDIFDLCGVNDTKFWPVSRQEVSRRAGGVTQGKDLGSPLWHASFTTAPASHDDAGDIEMALLSLRGVINAFEAHDLRRPYPKAHADGAFADTATIKTLPSHNRSLALQGLPSGFQISVGDYVSFDYGPNNTRALHRFAEAATADGGGAIGLVDVFPLLRPGAIVGSTVRLKMASCFMSLNPNSVTPSMPDLSSTSLTFSAVQII